MYVLKTSHFSKFFFFGGGGTVISSGAVGSKINSALKQFFCIWGMCISDLLCKQLLSGFFFFFLPLSEALGTINPTDYSAPLLLDWTFTISRGRQQWGPDESNIHGISFTLLPLSHAPPPLCQAPVWWEGLLTLAAPIDRQFCKDRPQQPYQSTNAPPSSAHTTILLPPKIGNKTWLVHQNPWCLFCRRPCVKVWAFGVLDCTVRVFARLLWTAPTVHTGSIKHIKT